MKYKKLLLRQYTLEEYKPIIEHLYLDCLYQLGHTELDGFYEGMTSLDNSEEIKETYFLKLINLLKDFPNEIKNKIRNNISESLVTHLRDELFMDTEMIITLMCAGSVEEDYDEENQELIQSEIKEEIEYFSAIGMIDNNGVEEEDGK